MSITKRIVQTHRSSEIMASNRQTWIDHHPEFEYCFYNDEACEKFFIDFYSDFLSTWKKLPNKAQKADFFRYLNVYHFGGVYADVDTICKAPINSYVDLEEEQLVVGEEMSPELYKKGFDSYVLEYCSPRQYAQWIFAASARFPLLLQIVRSIHKRVDSLSVSELEEFSKVNRFTLELTGPIFFTSAINQYTSLNQALTVTALPQLVWGYNPWHNLNVDPIANDGVKSIHTYEGSWKSGAQSSSNVSEGEADSIVNKKIAVFSHERSGTHFLMNSIACNFNYDAINRWDYDYNIPLDFHSPVDMNKYFSKFHGRFVPNILKSHHHAGFMRPVINYFLDDFHVFYIVRDPRDVMLSFRRFVYKNTSFQGARTKRVSEFVRCEPSGGMMRYQIKQEKTVLQRWASHVESWLFLANQTKGKNIHFIKYEDLNEKYEWVVNGISQILQQPLTSIVRPGLDENVIDASIETKDTWRNLMDEETAVYILDEVGPLMKRLGYS